MAVSPPFLRNSYTTPSDSTTTQANVDVTAGDLIIVAFRSDGTSLQTTTCSDNAAGGSNTYREVGSGVYISNATSTIHLFYAIAKATETIGLITITTGESGYTVVTVHVVANMDQNINTVLDSYSFGSAEGAAALNHTSNAIVTNFPNAYLFCFWTEDVTNSVVVTEGDTGFTKRQSNTDYYTGGPSASLDKVVSETGTYFDRMTCSPASYYAHVIAAFRGMTTGGPGAFQANAFQNNAFQVAYDATRMFLTF
jgi:hypothetical protein